jgi:trk system potassium uptake protein TrkA
MKVIVVGCGRIGSTLAYQLDKNGHQVTVIDQEAAAFKSLPVDFHGRTVKGDVLVRQVLRLAEIEDADALAAVTNSDSLNALVAYIAKSKYHLTNVVAWNCILQQRPLQEAFAVPVVSSASTGATQIEEILSASPIHSIYSNEVANITIYQFEVPERWNGCVLQELLPLNKVNVIALTRLNNPLDISGTIALHSGDVLILSAKPEEIEKLLESWSIAQERTS